MPRRIAVIGGYGVGLSVFTDAHPPPGGTVSGCRLGQSPGGKGSNQAVAAARLGASVALLTGVGDDAHGPAGRALWAREGVDDSAVRTGALPTMLGVIIVEAGGENRILVAPGTLDELGPPDVERFRPALRKADVCLVSLEVPLPVARTALRLAREAGVRTVLDPAPAAGLTTADLADVDVLIPNRGEAAQLAGCGPDDPVEVVTDRLRARFGGDLVVTDGRDGAVVAESGGAARERIGSREVTAVDTTGAGDAFAGAFAVALAGGASVVEAARLGVAAGTHAVGTAEVVPSLPYPDDLPEGLRGLLPSPPDPASSPSPSPCSSPSPRRTGAADAVV